MIHAEPHAFQEYIKPYPHITVASTEHVWPS